MAFDLRFQYYSGNKLAIKIERLSDKTFYDGSTGMFIAQAGAPATAEFNIPIAELPGDDQGEYSWTLDAPKLDQWTDGNYAVAVKDMARAAATEPNTVVAMLAGHMLNGDGGIYTPANLFAAITSFLKGKNITVGLPA